MSFTHLQKRRTNNQAIHVFDFLISLFLMEKFLGIDFQRNFLLNLVTMMTVQTNSEFLYATVWRMR